MNDESITPFPLRMPHELRKTYEAMADNTKQSLNAEILATLYKASEGFEAVETIDQAIKALKINQELMQHLVKQNTTYLEMIEKDTQ